MQNNVWLPAYIGCGLCVLALGLSFVLTQVAANSRIHRPIDAEHTVREPSRSVFEAKDLLCLQPLKMLRSNSQVIFVMIASFAFPLGEDSMYTIVLLYISKRYGRTIADVSLPPRQRSQS
jgi:hypothetical protein